MLLVGTLVLWSSGSPTEGETTRTSATMVLANSVPVAPVAPVETTPPPAASPSVNRVRLTVETFPRNARVSVDDAFLPPNAPVVELTKDTVLHKIRAEALGYRGKTEWVRFDSDDVTVKISLDPMAPSRKGRKESAREGTAPPSPLFASEPLVAPTGVAAPPPPAPTQPQIREIEPAPARQRAPAAPLDTGDPWKK